MDCLIVSVLANCVHEMNISRTASDSQAESSVSAKTLGDRLASLRKTKGYSQKKFADMLGIHPITLLKYEKNQIEAGTSVLLKAVSVTKCDPGWLLTGKEPEAREVSITGSKTDDYAMIPFSHEVAAGTAREAEIEEEPVIVHRRLLARHHVSSDKCRAYRVRGRSMEPKLQDGDIIVCAMLQSGLENLDSKGLYCVHSPEGVTVKKVHYDSAHKSLILAPLNPEFPLETIRLTEAPVLLGKVIGIWKDVD